MRSTAHLMLLGASAALSTSLCVWGAVGWGRAYRAEAEVNHLTWADELRDAQLLGVVVRGGEAAAQLALEKEPEVVPPAPGGCAVPPPARWADFLGGPE
jgi:hypothetical protein